MRNPGTSVVQVDQISAAAKVGMALALQNRAASLPAGADPLTASMSAGTMDPTVLSGYFPTEPNW